MLPRIYAIRHGETVWSRESRHTSVTELPLTPRGEELARGLGPALRGIEFAFVLTSPRLRARRTCELAGYGANAEIEPALAEWNYGEYEGLTLAEIHAERSGWSLFRDGCPGGETPEQVSLRADSVVARLRRAPGNVAIFSHGHFLRALAARWVGWPVLEGRPLLLDPASVSVLGFEHNHLGEPAIARWNTAP